MGFRMLRCVAVKLYLQPDRAREGDLRAFRLGQWAEPQLLCRCVHRDSRL